jgi:hypothetical protein
VRAATTSEPVGHPAFEQVRRLQRQAGNAAVTRAVGTTPSAQRLEILKRPATAAAAGSMPSVMVMREHLFASTLEIARRLLISRTFRVTQGGIRVTADAAYERRGTPEVSSDDYRITLTQEGLIFDSEYGTAAFAQGRPVSRQWTDLPDGDYHLTIFTNNTNPHAVLVGDIVVEQSAELTGPSATEAPPGPLEILHTALDLAGLVPVLGALPDAANAGIYVIEGDFLNAGLSAVAIIPIFGEAATVGKIGARTVVRVSGEAVERVGREGIETGLRQARTRPRIDPGIDARVEQGIIEEAASTGPARHPRPAAPATRGAAASARTTFDGLRDGYAHRLGVTAGGQVHHAVELQVLDRYPGVFSAAELNDFTNMRGIATELASRQQLHGSKVREVWNRHYRAIDAEVGARGLTPGTTEYNQFVRQYLESGRAEIDHVLGQFFTEYRSALDWTPGP